MKLWCILASFCELKVEVDVRRSLNLERLDILLALLAHPAAAVVSLLLAVEDVRQARADAARSRLHILAEEVDVALAGTCVRYPYVAFGCCVAVVFVLDRHLFLRSLGMCACARARVFLCFFFFFLEASSPRCTTIHPTHRGHLTKRQGPQRSKLATSLPARAFQVVGHADHPIKEEKKTGQVEIQPQDQIKT